MGFSVPLDFLIIANPTSGAQAAPTLATRVKELLAASGKAVELRVTQKRGDAQAFAAAAKNDGVGTVVGCGGDGTLQEIASGLLDGHTQFGILPGGRCNDFAHALGLSKTDSPERLTDVLLNGTVQATDVGMAGEHVFLTVATLGFDSDVSRFVEGTPAYFYAVFRTLLSLNCPRVKLSGDFGEIDGRVLLAATGNSSCYGGALHIAPGARVDDGLFQVCVVEAVSRFTVMRILPKVLKGKHVEHPAVKLHVTKSMRVESLDGPLLVCADGETIGPTPMTFQVRPGALKVMVPKK
jgi:diacylglycerol kinase (ATP)